MAITARPGILARLETVAKAIETVAGLMLAVITIVVFVSVMGRYLFTSPIPDSFDLARLLMGATIMWGFAALGFRGRHISVDLISHILPPVARRLVDAFAALVLLGFTALLAYMMFSRVSSAYFSGETTFDLRLPVWPFVALTWGGAAAAVLTTAIRLVLIVTGRAEALEAEAGAAPETNAS
ncbi:TRAP transporter small permease [Cucumibacter marinus]|uniref:TRAP transporter small permease n=1 Tax=Cucumibacter marinus TaxID=1121252 RepID=UPI0003F8FF8D|nr:TRAP transporter small permease [Cucumibacter marinus]